MDVEPERVAAQVRAARAHEQHARARVQSAAAHAPAQRERRQRAHNRARATLRKLERVQARAPVLLAMEAYNWDWGRLHPSIRAQRYRNHIQRLATEAARHRHEGNDAGYYVAAHCAWQRKEQFERELPGLQPGEPGQPRWPSDRRLLFHPPDLPPRAGAPPSHPPSHAARQAALGQHQLVEHLRAAVTRGVVGHGHARNTGEPPAPPAPPVSLPGLVSYSSAPAMELSFRVLSPSPRAHPPPLPLHTPRTDTPPPGPSHALPPPPVPAQQIFHRTPPQPNTPPMPPGLYEAVEPHLYALAGRSPPAQQPRDSRADPPPAADPPTHSGLHADVAPRLDALPSGYRGPARSSRDEQRGGTTAAQHSNMPSFYLPPWQ